MNDRKSILPNIREQILRNKFRAKRYRQLPVLQRDYETDFEMNQESMTQHFQVAVNVIEARNLAWLDPHSATSYVLVVLGNDKRRTGIQRCVIDPSYKEYFVFDQCANIVEIHKMNMWIAVMEPRSGAPSSIIGEATIDLSAVWAQPYHQILQSWIQLTLPHNKAAGVVGFLKLDISITFKGDVQLMPATVTETNIEEKMLLRCRDDQQPANFVVTIYGIFSLSNGCHLNSDKVCGKPVSSFVKTTFCGLSAKTAIQYRTHHPSYCEQMSFVEMFPNPRDVIKLEVFSIQGFLIKALATATLKLEYISHDGENGFLPTFGPSLLHMYDTTACGSQTDLDQEGPYHRGAMLVSLKTNVPYYQQPLRSVNVEPATPMKPQNLWVLDDFYVLCPILEVSMLDRQLTGKQCGVAITTGELPTDDQGDEEFVATMLAIKSNKYYYTGSLEVQKNVPVYGYLSFPKAFPVLQLATRLPDFRFRMFRNNMINAIAVNLENTISNIENVYCKSDLQLLNVLMDDLNKGIDEIAGNLLMFLDVIQYSGSVDSLVDAYQKYNTDLDKKQLALQKEKIELLYQQLTKRSKNDSRMNLIRSVMHTTDSYGSLKKELKLALAELKVIAQELRSLIFKTSDGWPHIVIWLLSAGSRVAYYRIPATDVIYSMIPEQSGKFCGQIRTIYLKPVKCLKHPSALASNCNCFAGKIELMLWMGLFRQVPSFHDYLPKGYVVRTRNYDMCVKTSSLMLEYRVFVYKAKLQSDDTFYEQMCPFVRVNVINAVRETEVRQKTSSPVWNQVMKIQSLVYATHDRISKSPPTVLVEICDRDVHSGKTDLVGRVEVQPIVEDRQNYEFAPKLQWYKINKGIELAGQILMSVQTIQIPETLMRNIVYCPVVQTYVVPGIDQLLPSEGNVKEPLPQHLIPKCCTYKVDIYWWGLRDVISARKPCVYLTIDDFIVKSDIIQDKKMNCNFPNGRMSQTFEAPMEDDYSPPLCIRLYDNGTFGRTLFLGSNVIKNMNKYTISWQSKAERDASLHGVSIIASNFSQVSELLYVKKSAPSESDCVVSKNTNVQDKAQTSLYMKLFSRREPTEEECYLLPIFNKKQTRNKVTNKCDKIPEIKDWWTRFCSSETDDSTTTDKVVIYYSELEAQPEFSKFKDWCSTLKLYNGTKTGIPEKDNQLYCGLLKAGIAIYSWPPDLETSAVSHNGVDLNYGYFDDYPNNEPSKFLVRVYVVKAIDLKPKEFTGRLDSYVVISCGEKHLGDRKSFIPNNVNPRFGRLFEFRCTLPEEYLLTVSLYDYGTRSPDDLIGSTTIDLEDRIYSKHRALVGLPFEYNTTGPGRWRDSVKPSYILDEICRKNHIPPPIFRESTTVSVNGIEYTEENDNNYKSNVDRKENICLNLLRNWHTMPICGHHLVPEHVETRTLYNLEKPDERQGKLLLWVDIFPLDTDLYIPPAIDITTPRVETYELRLIVWNVQGIKILDHPSKMPAKLYVRAYMDNFDKSQCTDGSSNNLSGNRSFNWRMIFHFQYQRAENKMVKKERNTYTEFEEYVDPLLIVQVMEAKTDAQDELLGQLAFNLNEMPKGAKEPSSCWLKDLKKLNLFTTTSTRGWWPMIIFDNDDDDSYISGVIELELTLLPIERAISMPVGLGRDPPDALPEPKKEFSRIFKRLNSGKELICYITAAAIIIAFLLFCAYLYAPVDILEEE